MKRCPFGIAFLLHINVQECVRNSHKCAVIGNSCTIMAITAQEYIIIVQEYIINAHLYPIIVQEFCPISVKNRFKKLLFC